MNVLSTLPNRSPLFLDVTTSLDVIIENLVLSSQSSPTLPFAIETERGWEIILAQTADLIAPSTYRLGTLVRGAEGSESDMVEVPAGARIIWLGQGLETLALRDEWRGTNVTLDGASANRAARTEALVWEDRAGRPLSPTHLVWNGSVLQWVGRDIAYTDWSDSDEAMRFRVNLTRGTSIETLEVVGPYLETEPFEYAEVWGLSASGRESAQPATLNVPSG